MMTGSTIALPVPVGPATRRGLGPAGGNRYSRGPCGPTRPKKATKVFCIAVAPRVPGGRAGLPGRDASVPGRKTAAAAPVRELGGAPLRDGGLPDRPPARGDQYRPSPQRPVGLGAAGGRADRSSRGDTTDRRLQEEDDDIIIDKPDPLPPSAGRAHSIRRRRHRAADKPKPTTPVCSECGSSDMKFVERDSLIVNEVPPTTAATNGAPDGSGEMRFIVTEVPSDSTPPQGSEPIVIETFRCNECGSDEFMRVEDP